MDIFADTIEVNLTASMRAATVAGGKLAAVGGCIINVASMLSFQADPSVPHIPRAKPGCSA